MSTNCGASDARSSALRRLGWFKLSLLSMGLSLCSISGVSAQADEVSELIARLRGEDVAQRDAAAAAAANLGATAVAAIGALLAVEDLDVVAAAERALIGITARATAPGNAEGERAASVRAFFDLMRQEMPLPPAKRTFLLRQISLMARGANETIEVARFLDEPALAEVALFALERIPSPVVDALLLERLARAEVVQPSRAALVATLGARRSRAAVPTLVELAGQDNAALAQQAREALARIGDSTAAPVLRAAAQRGEAGAAEAYLRLLEHRLQLAHSTLNESAEALPPLLSAPAAGTRLAAIEVIQEHGFDAPLGTWIGMLGDPADTVRKRVQALLIARQGDGLDETLAEAAVQGTPAIRIGALHVLDRRDTNKARPLLLAAAKEGEAVLRSAAIAILVAHGDPADDALYLEALAVADVTPAACDALLLRAAIYAQAQESATARERLLPLLSAPLDAARRSRALLALAPLAQPADLEAIESFATSEELREEVAAVRLGIAERLPEAEAERAVALLWQVVDGSSDRARLRATAAAFKARGIPADGIARKQGFVTRWKLMGSFARSDGKAFAWWPFAEAGPTLQESLTIDDINYTWRDVATEDFEGHVDLLRQYELRENCYVFAAADVEWSKDESIELRVGSDDGIVVWVNGKLVHQNDTTRSLKTDEDRCTAEFRQGTNRIVLKIVQGGGGFGYCLRLPKQ